MNHSIRCFSCHAPVADEDGPTHPYMESAPGCWKLYGEVLARQHATGRDASATNQIIVDTYAVQHPGRPGRKAIQSVNIHLISLYCQLEQGLAGPQAVELIRRTVENEATKKALVWLEPPDFTGTGNVAEVVRAEARQTYVAAVQRWGNSVWEAWKSKHFQTIRNLAQQAQGLH